MSAQLRLVGALALGLFARAAVTQEPYVWENVKIGGGGGFVPNIIFNPSVKGLAYSRCGPINLTSAKQKADKMFQWL